MMSICTIPELHCIGCYQCICSGTCLATHRDRYCCHNPSCQFHAPCPAPPEPIQQPTARPAAPERKAIEAPSASDANDTERETSAAGTLGNSNVTCRETITREWFRVGGEPVTAQAGATESTLTSGPDTSAFASTTPAPDTTSGTDVDQSSTPPARFTIEEYQAQARLLAQYQTHRGRQPLPAQRDGRIHGSNGSGQGASRRPRVWIQWG